MLEHSTPEKTDQEKNSADGAPEELGCHGMREIESRFHGIPVTLHNRGPPDNYDRRWNIIPEMLAAALEEAEHTSAGKEHSEALQGHAASSK